MTSDTSDTADIAASHARDAASTAQEKAGEVTAHAQDAAHQVAGTAAEQAQNVKDETVRQARNLAGEAGGQLSAQAKDQTQRLVGTLRELGDELKGMAEGGQPRGTATELVHQGAERVHGLAGYLDGKEPAEILDDARAFARRRPGAFLAGAAVLGLLAGRVGRGVKDAGSSDPAGPGVTRADATTPTSTGTIPPVGPGIQPAELDAPEPNMGASTAGLPERDALYHGIPPVPDEDGVRL